MNKIIYIISVLLFIGYADIYAQPMNYNSMHNNARFLTDRIAVKLSITSSSIIDDIYRINYDYICGVNDYLDDVALGYYNEEYNLLLNERNKALETLLGKRMWDYIMTFDYLYNPIRFENKGWRFSIYTHDGRFNYYYLDKPNYYRKYSGGHFFKGMKNRGIRPINRTIKYKERVQINRTHKNTRSVSNRRSSTRR